MKTIGINDSTLTQIAYWRANRALPPGDPKNPQSSFDQQWRDTYRCRVRGDQLEFETDVDCTWFLLKWS